MFAVVIPALLQRHLLDLVVLGVAAVLVAVRPRLAPYVVVVAVLFPSPATHLMSSDGLALAGVAAGLAAHRLWRRDQEFGPAPTGPLVALAALDLLLVLSLLANHGEPQAAVAYAATGYFISRTVLIGAVVVLASPRLATRLDWLCAAALGGLVLAVTRGLELVGVPVQAVGDRLAVQVLGSDFTTWNVYALVVAVCAFLALAAAEQLATRRYAMAMRAVALVLLAAAGTASSRTALVAAVLVLIGLAALAPGWRRRVQYAALAVAVAAGTAIPAASVLNKPVVVSTHAAAAQVPESATPATGPGGPAFSPPRGLSTSWRVLLNQPSYRFQQTFSQPELPAHGNYVVLLARAAGRAKDVQLRITVNGVLVSEMTAAEVGPKYRWISVPVPDTVMARARGSVAVSVDAAGPLDSKDRYFSVGGTDAISPSIASASFANGRPIPGDLSADPGVQRGMGLIFLDGRVPVLLPLPPAQTQAVDESISDRLTLWRAAWHVFLRHPLLGTGFNTFGSAQSEDPQSALFASYGNAHDNLLDVLSDLGILGPVLLLVLQAAALLALLGWPPVPGGPDRWWRLTYAGAVAVMLVMGVTQTWLADGRSAMLAWIVLLVAGGAGGTRVHDWFARSWMALTSRARGPAAFARESGR